MSQQIITQGETQESTLNAESDLPTGAQAQSEDDDSDKTSSISTNQIGGSLFAIGITLITLWSRWSMISGCVEDLLTISRSFVEKGWDQVYILFGGNDFLMVSIGGPLVAYLTFWTFGSLYLYVEITGKPEWMHKYKIQTVKPLPLKREEIIAGIKHGLFNQFLILPTSIPAYYLWKLRGLTITAKELPTIQRFLLDIAFCALVEEVLFYYIHRSLHHPLLYKRIHKIHHERKAPACLDSLSGHPLEQIVCNLAPAMLGPALMGSHVATGLVWTVLGYMSSVQSHSGFHLPFLPSPEAHDFHHLKFVNNFGALGILDRLHGTDSLFRKSIGYKRHFWLTSFKPVRYYVPDIPKGSDEFVKKCQ